MTVLQKHIKDLQDAVQAIVIVSGVESLATEAMNGCIDNAKSFLPAEEQQIRDAWKSAQLHKKAMDYDGNDWAQKPDLETYISTLKQ